MHVIWPFFKHISLNISTREYMYAPTFLAVYLATINTRLLDARTQCYDLRFPELSISLTQQGAEILTYPSAFTVQTGAAHWEVGTLSLQ